MEGSTRVTGTRPAALVWERYAVPARWPEWAPQITGVDTGAARIVAGATGRVRGPLGVRIRFVVSDVDEYRRTWAWVVRFGPVRLFLRHGVELHPAGSCTWLTVDGPAAVVAAYLPIARLALRRLVQADPGSGNQRIGVPNTCVHTTP